MEEREITIAGSGKYSPALTAAVRADTVREIVNLKRKVLAKAPVMTDLNDVEAVRQKADEYLEHCSEIGFIPSFVGLAAALGCSRKTLYQHADGDTETARFLKQLRSLFTDCRIAAADRNAAPESMTIFLLKNGGEGFTDRVEIQPLEPKSPFENMGDPEQARRRLIEAIPDDEDA